MGELMELEEQQPTGTSTRTGRTSTRSTSINATATGSSNMSSEPRFWPLARRVVRLQGFAVVLLCIVFLVAGVFFIWIRDEPPVFLSSLGLKHRNDAGLTTTNNDHSSNNNELSESYLPNELFDLGLYQESDFVNEIGISPPFWKPDPHDGSGRTWGPCYPQQDPMDWFDDRNNTEQSYVYQNIPMDKQWPGPEGGNGGLCRPGFLILGAGKCGTSSLYQYLVGHPRVVPAVEKQIHYFIYNLQRPIEWYYSWFPTASSFLQHGALLTGEASPGYLPYPKAAKATRDRMVGNPKLIVIGRNPLTRMYSSYRYNYRDLALKDLKRGILYGKANQEDDYYNDYLFTFEQLVKAELQQLRNCLEGFGIADTRTEWFRHNWTRSEFDRREREGLDPLMDLDFVCYGRKPVNRTVLREQWADLQMKHPGRYIPAQNAFLIQSIIGRSLYALPLEWWYMVFDSKDIIFYCTEDLNDIEKFNNLSMELGLPSYNYSQVMAQGAFNVGGHRGYDKATPWNELEPQEGNSISTASTVADGVVHGSSRSNDDDTKKANNDNEIPLSPELRKEVLDFFRPYNERLFRLVGKRCDWTST